mgnify:FL=1|tara:strand:+ start:462 stop:944 length:483 start_codon:yes stop_codon:yes gene_type:complete
MAGRFSPNQSPLRPHLLTGEGIPVRQILHTVVFREYNRTFSIEEDEILPPDGIVRKITKNSDNNFELLLEIGGITSERCDQVSGKISLSDYENNLLPVVLSSEQFDKLPVANEVVDLNYKDPTDISTIFRISKKSTQLIDPNYEKCRKNTRTSSNFTSGA